jgi:hypothetical protein
VPSVFTGKLPLLATSVLMLAVAAVWLKPDPPCTSLQCRINRNPDFADLYGDNRKIFLHGDNDSSDIIALEDPEHKAMIGPLMALLSDHTDNLIRRAPQYRSCAVIGNSANMLGMGYGPLIDGHEAVFRMNRAEIKGYEADVGTKTTYRLLWSNLDFKESSETGKTYYVYYPHGWRTQEYPIVYKEFALLIAALLKDPEQANAYKRSYLYFGAYPLPWDQVLMLDFHFLKYVAEKWEFSPFRKAPGTGVLSIIMALHMCDQVSVFGFSTTRSVNFCYYYDDPRGQCKIKKASHFAAQEKFLDKLNNAGFITFYEGDITKLSSEIRNEEAEESP